MTAADTTLEGQAAAEQLMVDSCTITRAGARGSFDSTTGTYSAAAADTRYTGKCRVKPSALSANQAVQAGERAVSLWPFTVSVPIAVDNVELDDIVTVTASADPSLVGHRLRVRSIARGTYLTARRLDCEEATT